MKQTIRDMATRAAATRRFLDAWKHLAEVQYRAGQIDRSFLADAEKSYRHVLEREPKNLDVLRNLGNISFDQEQPSIATEFYQRYLEIKPDDLNVQTDLGTMYLSAGDSEKAVRQYDAVLKQNPNFFQAQFNLAIAYRAAGQNEAAIAALHGRATWRRTTTPQRRRSAAGPRAGRAGNSRGAGSRSGRSAR